MIPRSAEQYQKWASLFKESPAMTSVLLWGNRIETYLFYVAFPLLLILLAVAGEWELLLRAFATSAIAFVLVTLVRRWINAPRPYEAYAIDPLIKKDTKGKSLPSRHVFSCFMIAMCWLAWNIPVGVVLLLLGVDMGFVRVVGGVHFVRDVVCGALIGVAAGIIGLWIC